MAAHQSCCLCVHGRPHTRGCAIIYIFTGLYIFYLELLLDINSIDVTVIIMQLCMLELTRTVHCVGFVGLRDYERRPASRTHILTI